VAVADFGRPRTASGHRLPETWSSRTFRARPPGSPPPRRAGAWGPGRGHAVGGERIGSRAHRSSSSKTTATLPQRPPAIARTLPKPAPAETVRDQPLGTELPAHEALDEVLHQPEARHPGAVDRLLVVDHVGDGCSRERASLAQQADAAPFACSPGSPSAGLGVGRAVERALDARAARQPADLGDVCRAPPPARCRRGRASARARAARE